jgi:hypothetical protein
VTFCHFFEKGSSSCIFTRLVSLDTAVLSHRVQRSICELSFLVAQFKCHCPHVIVFTSGSSSFVFFFSSFIEEKSCSFMLWNEIFLVSGSVARGSVPMTNTRFWRKNLNEKSFHFFHRSSKIIITYYPR